MSRYRDWMSAAVGFILFNPRQDPIKLSRGYLAPAECTNAADVHFERGTTVGAVQIGTSGLRFRVAISDKGPLFSPETGHVFRTSDDASSAVNRIVKALSRDSQGDRVVEGVFLNLDRLHGMNGKTVEDIALNSSYAAASDSYAAASTLLEDIYR